MIKFIYNYPPRGNPGGVPVNYYEPLDREYDNYEDEYDNRYIVQHLLQRTPRDTYRTQSQPGLDSLGFYSPRRPQYPHYGPPLSGSSFSPKGPQKYKQDGEPRGRRHGSKKETIKDIRLFNPSKNDLSDNEKYVLNHGLKLASNLEPSWMCRGTIKRLISRDIFVSTCR